MSARTKRWPSPRVVGLVLVASLPFLSGAVCREGFYEGPGIGGAGQNCTLPETLVASVPLPMEPVCAEDGGAPQDHCGCQDFGGGLPPGVILPSDDHPIGCHHDIATNGIKYILPGCAHIAELSGRVMHYVQYSSVDGQDNDANVELCPDVPTMRVDPFGDLTSMELRTQGTFLRDFSGAMHIEVQDCRWYDGTVTINAELLGFAPGGQFPFTFFSRPVVAFSNDEVFSGQHDMFSAVGDWVADFNHTDNTRENAHAEIHEARAVALVKPVIGTDIADTISVATVSAFFAAETPQRDEIHFGIKMLPQPSDSTKHWKLHCRVLKDDEFSAYLPCGTKPQVTSNIEPDGDAQGRCNLLLKRNDAVEPLPFQCTDMCDNKQYVEDWEKFCDNIHFMNPVVGEWVDPADLWMCQCPCDDPSAPGATIAAPVQGCAQINLDPTKPEDQQMACAQVCSGQICGAAPSCRIGECHAPASGGTAQLIARGVCDPAKPQPVTRVSAAGDYHVTIDHNASSFEVNFDALSATSTLDGTLHFNLNESSGIRVVDIADSRTFPEDFSLTIASVTNATVVSSSRVLGQFGMGTAFQIPANSGSFGAEALVAGKLLGGEVLNPDAMTGSINVPTREFAMDFIAEAPPESSAEEEASGRSVIAHIVGTIDNVPPVAVSGGPTRTVECTSPTLTPVTLNGSLSFDSDPGDSISHYQWFTAAGLGVGNHALVSTSLPMGHSAFALHVYDADLGSAAAPLDVNVVDSIGPTLTISPQDTCMWPPNHKRIRFRLGTDVTATATDACDAAPTVRIIDVTSSQPDNFPGDGNTINDASFSDHAFCIRRERTPQLGERLYLITVEARDASGNTTTKVLPIRVAANNSGGGQCPSIGTVITEDAPCE